MSGVNKSNIIKMTWKCHCDLLGPCGRSGATKQSHISLINLYCYAPFGRSQWQKKAFKTVCYRHLFYNGSQMHMPIE